MSITVRVKFAGILKKYARGEPEGFQVQLPDTSSVGDLVRVLDIPPEIVGLAMINGQKIEGPGTLQEGDQVQLWPPMVAGG